MSPSIRARISAPLLASDRVSEDQASIATARSAAPAQRLPPLSSYKESTPLAETAVLSVALDAAALNRAESPGGSRRPAGPYRSFTILKERRNNLSGKLRVVSQLAVLPTCKPMISANPKTPIARGEQASNIVAGEMLTRWRLPWDAPNAIEAKQTEFRAEPEITVGRLSN